MFYPPVDMHAVFNYIPFEGMSGKMLFFFINFIKFLKNKSPDNPGKPGLN